MLVLLLACSKPDDAPVDTPTHDTLAEAEALAARGRDIWAPENIALSWIETVWAYGLHRLYAKSGDEQWQDYYRAWMDDELPDFVGDGRGFNSSDTLSPSTIATILMIEDDDADYTAITETADEYLDTVPTTSEGAIVHWTQDDAFRSSSQIWIDSLFMFGVYMLRAYERTGDRDYLERWHVQYILFSDLCRDPNSQLYFHAYDDETGATIPPDPVFWARGNSWVLISAGEALKLLPEDDPVAVDVLPRYQSHAQAFLDTQADDGLWHTVLNQPHGDDPDNYTETSAAALIGYGLVLGVQSGALTQAEAGPTIDAAVQGVRDRIADDGALTGTSFGTNPGDYDYYLAVPTGDDHMLGIGTTVMFLAEAHGMPQ